MNILKDRYIIEIRIYLYFFFIVCVEGKSFLGCGVEYIIK